MVSLTLPELINEQKNRLLQRGGLELSFYQYCNDIPQTQEVDDFLYEDEKIAFSGFANLVVNDDRLKSLISEKQTKGIGYSANIYKFIGVHLAAQNSFSDIVNDKFTQADNKNQYAISRVFYKNWDCFKEKAVSNAKCNDNYKILIDFLIDENMILSIVADTKRVNNMQIYCE